MPAIHAVPPAFRFASFVRLLALAACALFAPRAAAQAPAGESIFGPAKYTRSGSEAQIALAEFDVPQAPAQCTVIVRNGDRERENRLSGVEIEIGGNLVVAANELGQAVDVLRRNVVLEQSTGLVRVRLSGPESGFISVEIVHASPGAPTASAQLSAPFQVGTPAAIDASASTGAPGAQLSFEWLVVGAPDGSKSALANATGALTSLTPDVDGSYSLRLLLRTGLGSAVTTLHLSTLSAGVNAPPIPSAGNNQHGEVGDVTTLDGSGSFDPEGLPVTYAWILGSAPLGSTATLDDPSSVAPSFTPDLPGIYVASLHVNDGAQFSVLPDRVRIVVAPFNGDPIANAGADQTVNSGDTVQLDGGASSDPEGQQLSFNWTFQSVPLGSSTALVNAATQAPSFVADVAGDYVVRLVVDDGIESSAPDFVTITALPGLVSVPNVVGLPQSAAHDALLGVGLAIGSIGAVQSNAVAAGAVASQLPTAGAVVPPGTAVDLDVAIGAALDITPPAVHVDAAPSIVAVGGNVVISVVASDASGVANVVLTVDGVVVPLDVNLQAVYVPLASGLFTVVATATDGATLSASDETSFRARSAVDNGAPVVALTSPIEDATLVNATSVIGTASDSDLALYELQLARATTGQFVTFATGSSSVTGAALGRLTPGSFTPGVYDLRVCASDTWGNSACSASVRVELDPVKRAPGLVSFAFLDGFVDVAGLPISVRRIYDGANKTVGDFGVGWHLETDSVKLETTRVMGDDWQIQKVGTIIPTYFLQHAKDHRVNVFLPDGTAHRFRMRPDPAQQQLFPIDFLNGCFFDALAGTTSTLTANDQPCFVLPVLASNGPVQIYDCNVEVYNPTGYTLDLVDGRRLTFVQDGSQLKFRLATLRDANNNVLTFGANGISHSAGAGVSWVRDGQGRITSITNPDGDTRTYTYDARGDLVSATDYAGVATQFVYDDAHNLVRVIDPRGFTPGTLIYNAAGQIVAMIDPDGNRVEITYDNVLNQQIVTDRLGNTTVYGFDSAGNMTSLIDALGHQSTFTFDTEGRVLSQTDPLGHVNAFTYDAEGRLLTHTDPLGRISSQAYDNAGHVTSSTDPLGHVTTYAYNAAGNVQQVVTPGGATYGMQHGANGVLSQVTDSSGATLSFATTPLGRLTAFTDAAGTTTAVSVRDDGQLANSSFVFNGQPVTYAYSYDANGQVVQTSMPTGTSATLERDAAGFPSSVTDTRGNEQQTVFDSEGNLLSFTATDSGAQSFEMDAENRMTAVQLPGGSRVERTLDALGRPTDVTFSDGSRVQTQFDAAGRPVSQQRVGQGVFTFGYDAASQLTQITAPDGGVSTTQYDANGQPLATVDPLGATTQMQHDVDGNLTQVTLPTGAILKSEFDDFGNLTAIEDPLGARVEYTYDAANQLIATRDAAGNTSNFVYDDMGNLSTVAMPSGNTWNYGYDALGNQRARTYPWGGTQTCEFDACGLITKITDATGSATSYAYDAAGRLVSTTPIGGAAETRSYDVAGRLVTIDEAGASTSLTHDSNGRLSRIDRPDGSFVEYTYDAAGRLSSVRTAGGTTSYAYDSVGRLNAANDTSLGVTGYSYDLAGRVSAMTLPDGSVTQVTRDARGSIVGLHTTNGANVIRSASYGLDLAGKLLSINEGARTVAYQYDAAGRLASETRTGPDAGNLAYAFDASWSATQIGPRLLSYDGALRLTSDGHFTNYSYDSAGRPIARSNATVSEQFYYDARSALIRVERTGALPSVVELEYDGFGLLSRIESDGVGRRLVWDPLPEIPRLLEERNDAGQLLKRYVHALGPIGVIDGTAHVLHVDPTASVRVITNGATGAIEVDQAYSAFGEATLGQANTTSSLRFAGELFVPELGLFFLRARFYDPRAGRFLTPDQLDPSRASAATFNPYQYADGNPVSLRDPRGLRTLSGVTIGISIAGILAGMALAWFPSPIAIVISGLVGNPPSWTYPVGAEIGFKASRSFGLAGPLAMTGGLKFKALTDWNSNWLGSVALETGLQLTSATPANLFGRSPSLSVSVGVIFGQALGPPKDPSPSVSLQLSGNIAAQTGIAYLETIRASQVLPGVLLTKIKALFQKQAASISIKLFSPPGDYVRDVFTVSVSANTNGSWANRSTSVGLFSATGSLLRETRYFGNNIYSAGLALNASVPIAWVHWTANGDLIPGHAWQAD